MTIIDLTDNIAAGGIVDPDNRGDWRDVLDVLAGLVTVQGIHSLYGKPVLAHFSVQEYLESVRILDDDARMFHLDQGLAHKVLAQCCLLYLQYYSNSSKRLANKADLTMFPFLEYASEYWFYHSKLQQHYGEGVQGFEFLTTEKYTNAWLSAYRYDWHSPPHSWSRKHQEPIPQHTPHSTSITLGKKHACITDPTKLSGLASCLYYASLLGLTGLARQAIDSGADLNAQGDWCGGALVFASTHGHIEIVKAVIDAGADMGTQGPDAILAASSDDHIEIVRLLIESGCDASAGQGVYGSAIQEAARKGHLQIVKLLVDANVDVNAKGGCNNSALQAASAFGHIKIAKLLIESGADVNLAIRTSGYSTALHAASARGHVEMVKLLIESGADVNAEAGDWGSGLCNALLAGHLDIAMLLIESGADGKIRGNYGNARYVAVAKGHKSIARVLQEQGVPLF